MKLLLILLALGFASAAPPQEDFVSEVFDGQDSQEDEMPYEDESDGDQEEEMVDLEIVREFLPDGYEILEVITVEDKEEDPEEEENENALDSPVDPRENEVLGANNGFLDTLYRTKRSVGWVGGGCFGYGCGGGGGGGGRRRNRRKNRRRNRRRRNRNKTKIIVVQQPVKVIKQYVPYSTGHSHSHSYSGGYSSW